MLAALTANMAQAQEVLLVENDSNQMEPIDMPEGMIVSEEDLMNDYSNREGLSIGRTTAVRTLSYDDSLIVNRLSRIPTTIEMPLNNVTRKFIDTYSSRMKNSGKRSTRPWLRETMSSSISFASTTWWLNRDKGST